MSVQQQPVESRYKILERIDSGGMAEVFKGRARAIHGIEKTVAIKRILPHLAKNRKFVAMFLDEARLSVYLNHANIVQVFDIARSDGNYFIVMEFVEGANLRTLMEASRNANIAFEVEKAVYVAAAVCRGLSYAHARRDNQGQLLNIVHRDVSPPNILISFEGEVKLVDFGLAKAASQLEDSDPDILKGKLGYMSPEQAWGQGVDQRADLFATGILLYEMLSGARLFRGTGDIETLEMVRAANIPSLRSQNPRVPAELEGIVMRALSKNTVERYQDARSFEEDLWRFLFANRLKITPNDIGTWVRSIAQPRADTSSASVIDQMIQEEILRLVSIETYDLPDDSPVPHLGEGSRPIALDDFSLSSPKREATGAAQEFVGLTDILEPEQEPAAGGEPRAARDNPASGNQAATPSPVVAPQSFPPSKVKPKIVPRGQQSQQQPRGHAGWWVLAILVLAGITSGIYFLLRANNAQTPKAPPPAPTTQK